MKASRSKSVPEWVGEAWSAAKIGRLQIVILTTLLGSAAVLFTASWHSAGSSKEIEKQVHERLKAIGTVKKDSIETWYATIQGQIASQADSESTATALLTFSAARRNLFSDLEMNGVKLTDEALINIKKNVAAFYKNVLIKNLTDVRKLDPGSPESFMHPDPEANVLQYVYTAANPATVGNKYLLNTPNEVSQNIRMDDIDKNFREAFSKTSFARAIGTYHPSFNRVRERFGLYDIFLVDTDGYVVYTVFKELDFQGNLYDGPEKKTGLGLAFQEAMKPEKDPHQDGHLRVTSIEPYPKSYDAPAAFLASALWKDGKKVGALIYQLPLDKVNSIMTSSGLYIDGGLGETGESYLVNKDFILQNDSRFLAQLPSDKKLTTITADGNILGATTIGKLKAESPVAREALNGKPGTLETYTNYEGKEVIGYATVANFAGSPHAIVVEVAKSEALATALRQKKFTSFFSGAAAILFLVVSLYLGGLVYKPVRALIQCIDQLEEREAEADSKPSPRVHEEVGAS